MFWRLKFPFTHVRICIKTTVNHGFITKTVIDLNYEIFSIEKWKKLFLYFIFTVKDLKYYFKIQWQFFWGIFWGITYFCRSKNKDLGNSSWFSDIFSKNVKTFLKSSNSDVQKSYIPQNNPQKHRHNSHVASGLR